MDGRLPGYAFCGSSAAWPLPSASASAALAATARMRSGAALDIQAWADDCVRAAEAGAHRYDAPGEGVYAPALLKEISEAAGDDFVAACDVGQHQMWAAQYFKFEEPNRWMTSGGLGTMGYGLPASAPSLGELALQAKQNLQAPWLGFAAFFTFAIMLSLLVFIFEGVRDAFDPRKTFR